MPEGLTKKEGTGLLKLVTRSNHYEEQRELIRQDLSKANRRFATLFSDVLGIKDVMMSAIGNSISLGVSLVKKTVPLLKRNDDLTDTYSYIFNFIFNHYARPQNNADESTYSLLIEDTKLSQLNKLIHDDFRGVISNKALINSPITDEELDEYFPLNPEIDPTIRETIATKREGLANIIIYNGATGSLLDNGLRNGKHINFKGMFKKINKDIRDIEANLKAYYIINPNCQVYLCGIVKPFHINFAFHYNNKLKEITKRIPNVTYVEPAPVHVLQNKEGKLAIDIHPNEDKGEYSYINCSIITSIVDNYVSNQVCNDLLNAVKYVGERMTSEKLDSDKGAHLCTELIDAIFTRYYDDKKIDPAMIDKGIEKFRIHYRERYPHYYYYTYKEDVINQASQKIKK